ncbi:DUF4097 family beta strand repeat-containing protein [Nocardiopsis sp. CT-R113]|uniref:DUF4097 family beta strand repeat-containing protein n=1 Tax=Nocardiopsis codii TaxID=3065942 RepID=A0ABU7K427_9ACTN|nr:DUF4097 family beta strand repeat-containing protein [Nocardiopsis sp. CT-R113]MEE2036993.1 DUF4097 family beta strand repeat-containing protein [Nocardiopsis sp. CT-R113]
MTFKARGLYASSSKEPRRRFRVGPWLVIGGVLVVIIVAATSFSVLGNVGMDRGDRSDSYAGIRSLDVENRTGGGVTLTSGGDEVLVERTLRGTPLTEPRDRAEADGDSLDVEAACQGVLFFGGCVVDYEITVPEGTEVNVETISGRISAENLDGELELSTTSGEVEVSGNVGGVVVETTSGRITLDGVEGSVEAETTSGEISASGSGERLEASSTSGRVDVSGFEAETVTAESTSGDVSVGGGFTTAEASTVSGRIEVTTRDAFGTLTLESTSGSIDVRVPRGAYDVTGDSTSGSRDVDVDVESGAGARIDANTVSGSLSVEPN